MRSKESRQRHFWELCDISNSVYADLHINQIIKSSAFRDTNSLRQGKWVFVFSSLLRSHRKISFTKFTHSNVELQIASPLLITKAYVYIRIKASSFLQRYSKRIRDGTKILGPIGAKYCVGSKVPLKLACILTDKSLGAYKIRFFLHLKDKHFLKHTVWSLKILL